MPKYHCEFNQEWFMIGKTTDQWVRTIVGKYAGTKYQLTNKNNTMYVMGTIWIELIIYAQQVKYEGKLQGVD